MSKTKGIKLPVAIIGRVVSVTEEMLTIAIQATTTKAMRGLPRAMAADQSLTITLDPEVNEQD